MRGAGGAPRTGRQTSDREIESGSAIYGFVSRCECTGSQNDIRRNTSTLCYSPHINTYNLRY